MVITTPITDKTLPEELQSLYAPIFVNDTAYISSIESSDKEIQSEIILLEPKTEVQVKGSIGAALSLRTKIGLSLTEEQIKTSVTKALSEFDASRLNVPDNDSARNQTTTLQDFIVAKYKGAKIFYYSSDTEVNEWNENKIFHQIEQLRDEISKNLKSSEKQRFLLVYNPPMSNNSSVENPDTIITIRDTVKSDSIKVVGVTLNKTALSLTTGKSAELTAAVEPSDATNKELTWKSDNEAVATVNTDGNVKAIAKGKANITATATDGEKSAVCTVIVNSPVPNIPTVAQLNALLNKIGSSDVARDEMRKKLGNNLAVVGATNISNVQQLITDVSNGTHYQITALNTNANGKVVSITVKKQF